SAGGALRVRDWIPVLQRVYCGESAGVGRPAADTGARIRGWAQLCAFAEVGFVRAPLRSDCGGGATGRTDIGGAVWVCAGIFVDFDWRGAGGLCAGFYCAGGFAAAQREIAGGRGADGGERVYGIGGDVRGAADFAGDPGGTGSG